MPVNRQTAAWLEAVGANAVWLLAVWRSQLLKLWEKIPDALKASVPLRKTSDGCRILSHLDSNRTFSLY